MLPTLKLIALHSDDKELWERLWSIRLSRPTRYANRSSISQPARRRADRRRYPHGWTR
jgi:hypothetical protein